MNRTYFDSIVGLLEITEENNFITGLKVVSPTQKGDEKPSPVLKKARQQLEEYFSGKRKEFDLPLKQQGTPFQQKAWDYLCTIPYGKTISYKEEAESIGYPKAFRAIGSANGANNIAIIVPCHRVINISGKLGGYAYGLTMKEKLLALEIAYSE